MTIVPASSHLGGDTMLEQIARLRISDQVPQFKAMRALRLLPTSSSFGRRETDYFSESRTVTETPLQPSMTERAIDTATDVSRTITDASAALQAAVDRLSEAIRTARQPGKPLSTLSAITREAPLASLFVAFLFGLAVARRR
jgi:hypothetical protein